MKIINSIIILAILCSSCSSEKPSTPLPERSTDAALALEVTPNEPTRNSTLQLVARGFDLQGAKIEWFVDRTPFTTLIPLQFNGGEAAKGSAIQAKATVLGREVLSNVVKIMNTPPEIVNVKLLPEIIRQGDTIKIEAVGNDIDGDAVTMLYEWTRNGKHAGREQGMEGQLKRDDLITIRVTPYDGEAYGRSAMFNRKIGNSPPVISEHNEFKFDRNVYTYQVMATDPDNDELTFTLATDLDGMTISPTTGLLTWQVPADFTGKKNVTVVVKDGHGGIVEYALSFTIK